MELDFGLDLAAYMTQNAAAHIHLADHNREQKACYIYLWQRTL
jgi:hypothetical protein